MDVFLKLGFIYADLASSHSTEQVTCLQRLSRHAWMEMTVANNRHKPVAELVVEEVTLTTAVALDVGVWLEVLQAAARTGQLLTTGHCTHCVLRQSQDVHVVNHFLLSTLLIVNK